MGKRGSGQRFLWQMRQRKAARKAFKDSGEIFPDDPVLQTIGGWCVFFFAFVLPVGFFLLFQLKFGDQIKTE